MDEWTRRERQAELEAIDLWLHQCERERPAQWWGIVVMGTLIILILAELLKLALGAAAQVVGT